MITYRRLVSVDACDPLFVDPSTEQAQALALPPHGEAATTPDEKRRSMQKQWSPVFAHELVPLFPAAITATTLPKDVWEPLPLEERRRLWHTHVAADH